MEKDFKAVAEIIWNYLPLDNITAPEVPAWAILKENKVVVEKLADYFATQNPRFNRERFMKACRLGD
jgi:hypothetical protein